MKSEKQKMARQKVIEVLRQDGCKYPESKKCRNCKHCMG
jgi:hypothetical protein